MWALWVDAVLYWNCGLKAVCLSPTKHKTGWLTAVLAGNLLDLQCVCSALMPISYDKTRGYPAVLFVVKENKQKA